MSSSYANVVQTNDIRLLVKRPQSSDIKANILSKFKTKSSSVSGDDNLLSENGSNAIGRTGTYYIYDTSLTSSSIDENGYIAVLNGVILNYEFATPITVHIPSPQNLNYKVDKYSTEDVMFPTSVSGAPTSTPIVADIDYQYRG